MLEDAVFPTILIESIGVEVICRERIHLIVKQVIEIRSTQAMELDTLDLLDSFAGSDSRCSLAVIDNAKKDIWTNRDESERSFDVREGQGAVVFHVDLLPWRKFDDASWRGAVR